MRHVWTKFELRIGYHHLNLKWMDLLKGNEDLQ
jgi:hypothetical protein